MNLTALPALADNRISIFDDGAIAIVDDLGEQPGPVAEALDARRLEWRRF